MKIHLVPWSDNFGDQLGDAAGDDLLEIKYQVENGHAQAWAVIGHGVMVTRIDSARGAPDELVLVAGSGVGMVEVVEAYKKIASDAGITKIRAHTQQPAVGRLLEKSGLVLSEQIYRGQI
jgi:hypothetical protein